MTQAASLYTAYRPGRSFAALSLPGPEEQSGNGMNRSAVRGQGGQAWSEPRPPSLTQRGHGVDGDFGSRRSLRGDADVAHCMTTHGLGGLPRYDVPLFHQGHEGLLAMGDGCADFRRGVPEGNIVREQGVPVIQRPSSIRCA